MKNELANVKGLHPGLILERKLNEKNIRKGKFALSINEYPQTITAITKGKRNMNTALALRIEAALELEEGFLMTLQVFYDIRQEKLKQQKSKPHPDNIRPVLFWDTNIEKIDWERHSKAVIRRVFERGNKREKEEITRFYGKDKVNNVLSSK